MSLNPESLRDQHLATLSRLAEIGMKIATAIEMQADAVISGDVEAKTDFTLYPKLARSIRLTLMLQDKLLQPRALHKQQAHWAKADKAERIIRRVAEAEDREPAEVEHLLNETAERLESEDLYGDISTIPTSDLIARLCKDLGLNHDWQALSEEAWAEDEMSSRTVGWPLADVMATSRTLSPRWGKGRDWGGGSERQDLALMGSGEPPPDG